MKSVESGAALLDERLPGWRDHIDPNSLDLSGCEECILGQLFGDYSKGVELLGIKSPGKYGFIQRGRTTYGRLTDAWKSVLG
jgi:hypothetical protein